ncbi:A24 family peptidase [Henriciella sp.]|uniref:prepilin peptidase n=1 Tax=Henriciella sp. TaxID=1968823 RepID=UPI00261697A3|nr:A24 family peptidase [Henriciella sp.]
MILLYLLFILTGPFAGYMAAWLAHQWPTETHDASTQNGHDRWFFAAGAFAGLLVALSAYAFAPAGTFILSCLFGWTLLALATTDLKHYILPDPLNLTAAGLGLIMIWLTQSASWAEHLIGGLAGFGVLFAVEVSYRLLRGQEGLGRGDAKLLGALGLWVGWTRLPDILLVASLTGLFAVLAVRCIGGPRLNRTSAVAFGPWLALAGWVAWLSGPLLVPAP